MRPEGLRAARANRGFRTDEKQMRAEATVTVNPEYRAGGLYKIADCARTRSSSVRNRRPARTVSRPRNIATRR